MFISCNLNKLKNLFTDLSYKFLNNQCKRYKIKLTVLPQASYRESNHQSIRLVFQSLNSPFPSRIEPRREKRVQDILVHGATRFKMSFTSSSGHPQKFEFFHWLTILVPSVTRFRNRGSGDENESKITRMLRTPPFPPPKKYRGKPYLEVVSRFGL